MYLRILLRNIFSNWTGYLITVLAGFFVSPFIVHRLGDTGYGLWTLVLSLTGYFGMLDLGIRSSVSRFVARYIALNDHEQVNRTISAAVTILATGGILALTATAAAYFNFSRFHVEHQFEAAARTALLISGLNISIGLPLGVSGAILISLERFDVITGVTIAGAVTRACLVVAVLKAGGGLVPLAVVTLCVGMAEYSALAAWAKTLYEPLKIQWPAADFKSCKELLGFGVYRFIWIVANQLIFYTDSIVISAFLRVGDVTYYAIAGSLINYGRNVVSLSTDTLYPAAARLHSRDDMPALRELLIFGTRMSLLIALPLCFGLIFLGKQFIGLWMGPQYALSATILIVLAIPQFTSMSQYTSALILAGMAKHKILAYLAFGEGIANLLLSIFLVKRIGLIGVAWGTVIPHMISTGIIIPLYTLRILNMTVSEYAAKAYLRPLVSALPGAMLCYAFSQSVQNPSWPGFAAEALSVVGAVGIMSYFVCLTAEQQTALREKSLCLWRRELVSHES